MRPEEELARALSQQAARAAGVTVRIMGWTVRQRRAGERLEAGASSGAVGAPVALTQRGPADSTQRFFMVGRDGLADTDDWVLG